MIGNEVGPYRILEMIGQGGMGIVYKAVHRQIEQEVAVKVLPPEYARDPSMRRRFIEEAKLQAKLSHPHVANIFNYLEDASQLFLIMEYITGPTLERRLATAGPLPPEEAVAICRDVLAALSFMHSMGIIHRDIKPANIMFTDTGTVKVTDFGIAKATGEKGQTRTGMQVGTLCYMSPEQIQGRPASAASDIYALGITLYQMVTGRPPFQGGSEYTIMRGHIEAMPEPPWEIDPHISEELGQVILKALEKEPERRYRDAREFAAALAGLSRCSDRPALSGPPSPPMPSTKKPRARLNARRVMAGLASVGLLMTVVLSFTHFQGGGGPLLPHDGRDVTSISAPSASIAAIGTAPPRMAPLPITDAATSIEKPPGQLEGGGASGFESLPPEQGPVTAQPYPSAADLTVVPPSDDGPDAGKGAENSPQPPPQPPVKKVRRAPAVPTFSQGSAKAAGAPGWYIRR